MAKCPTFLFREYFQKSVHMSHDGLPHSYVHNYIVINMFHDGQQFKAKHGSDGKVRIPDPFRSAWQSFSDQIHRSSEKVCVQNWNEFFYLKSDPRQISSKAICMWSQAWSQRGKFGKFFPNLIRAESYNNCVTTIPTGRSSFQSVNS